MLLVKISRIEKNAILVIFHLTFTIVYRQDYTLITDSQGKSATMPRSHSGMFSYSSIILNFKRVVVRSPFVSISLAAHQGRSQPYSPGWARPPLSSNFDHFFLHLFKLSPFSSSFWHSGCGDHPERPWLRHCCTHLTTHLFHNFCNFSHCKSF